MALRLVELLVDQTAAQAAQLMIEYDPQPPFDCGAWPRRDADRGSVGLGSIDGTPSPCAE